MKAIPKFEYTFAHELDAAWIIALWKMIHGGDPAPELVAAQAIAALAPYAARTESSLTFARLQKQLAAVNIAVTEHEIETAGKREAAIEHPHPVTHQYCFKFGHETICITLPVVTHFPPPGN
jgi:hypothetical protein